MRHLVTNGRRLQIAAGVTLVGQEGVLFPSDEEHTALLEVVTEGVCFESMNLAQGVAIKGRGDRWCGDQCGGSLTMTKCTSTNDMIDVKIKARLVIEDSRVFGTRTIGISALTVRVRQALRTSSSRATRRQIARERTSAASAAARGTCRRRKRRRRTTPWRYWRRCGRSSGRWTGWSGCCAASGW